MKSIFKHAVWITALAGTSFTFPRKTPAAAAGSSVAFTGGLEDIIVETYYVSGTTDSTDTDGGHLAPGSVTYRIYVDMAPGYELQAVYATYTHPLYIATTTGFFNNQSYGQAYGNLINNTKLNKNTMAVDSWVTIGAASKFHLGVLKTADTDGSIIGGTHNDGGSALIPGGLLVDSTAGIPLTTADGLFSVSTVPQITTIAVDLSPFDGDNSANLFSIEDGMWVALNGAQGPTEANQVLIAQITTTGQLTFELNVQLRSPEGKGELYVASNPVQDEILFPALIRH